MSRSKSKRSKPSTQAREPTSPAPELPDESRTASPLARASLRGRRSDDAQGGRARPPAREPGARGRRCACGCAAYRVEVLLFLVSFVVLGALQLAALPAPERRAALRVPGAGVARGAAGPGSRGAAEPRGLGLRARGRRGRRCAARARLRPTDRWFVSFPSFPAVVMLPFVALHGYQFNDTSFGVVVGALAVALFFALLRSLARRGRAAPRPPENVRPGAAARLRDASSSTAPSAARCGSRAEVMGVAFTCLYLRNAVRRARPAAGRALLLHGDAHAHAAGVHRALLRARGAVPRARQPARAARGPWLRSGRPAAAPSWGCFALGAAPLAAAGGGLQRLPLRQPGRVRSRVPLQQPGQRRHRPLRASSTCTTSQRNLEAAFLKLPRLSAGPAASSGYDPHGLSLLLTLPLLVFLLVPRQRPRLHWPLWLTRGA